MRKILIFAAGSLLFLGCSNEYMATSVVQMAGNKSVAGWSEKGGTTTPLKIKTVVVKKVVKQTAVEKDSDGDWVPDSIDKCPDTPPNMTVNHQGCPIIATVRINFDFDRYYIKDIYKKELERVAEVLKNNPNMKIEISGYTDDVGNEKYNLELSKKRALAVRDMLVKMGVDPKRITVKGYGEKYPLVPNTNPTNRTLNRRVEIVDISDEL